MLRFVALYTENELPCPTYSSSLPVLYNSLFIITHFRKFPYLKQHGQMICKRRYGPCIHAKDERQACRTVACFPVFIECFAQIMVSCFFTTWRTTSLLGRFGGISNQTLHSALFQILRDPFFRVVKFANPYKIAWILIGVDVFVIDMTRR